MTRSLPILILVAICAPVAAQTSTITINTRDMGEPISPLIYGQFIEHLGRCIYGGLWAEMLEDRKFFYPVTGEAPAWELHRPGLSSWEGEGHPYEILVRSPWMILGKKESVAMDSTNRYVGVHAPRIKLEVDDPPGGLYQERLSLVDERSYTGRIVLAGDPGAAPVEVSLVWGSGASDRHTVTIDSLAPDYETVPLVFTAGGSTDNGRLEITGHGYGTFHIGAVSLMPSDNLEGWRSETVALLRELGSPVYRWPGGNFVSGYDWKDGIGEPDRRPPRKNPAWKGVEHNDVGIHEFMSLMDMIGAEPFVAVNTGLGGARSAAEQVEYANGSARTTMGLLRAKNGHPEPFDVTWWAVGNEMYGSWQLGHMPLSEYVKKHIRVVDAMREVDPSIRPVGVGSKGEWSEEMLRSASNHMSLISEHLYWQDEEDLVTHVTQISDRIREVADAHREYRREIPSLKDKDIRIAMDEWNYWYGPYEYGELGVRYYLQDALGIAAGLHEFFRNSDLFLMANYAQTVNVIGAIKTTKTEAAFETTGLVLKLYRHRFGVTPVEVTGDIVPLDVAAALTADRKAITIAAVNPTDDVHRIELNMSGHALAGPGRQWVITGSNRFARNAPGKPSGVSLVETALEQVPESLHLAPLSVTVYALEIE